VACAATLRALIEARAPLDLIGVASRFPLDEMVHVELCARMAMELGGGTEIVHAPDELILDGDPSFSPLKVREARRALTTGLSGPEELVDDAPLLEEDRFDVFVPVAIHDSVPANSQSIKATQPASQLLHVAAALGELTERAPDVSTVIWMNRAQASEDLLGDEHLHLGKSSREVHFVFPAS